MGGDKKSFDQSISQSVGRGSSTPAFPQKVGFDLIPFNANLGVIAPPNYVLKTDLQPTHDIAKIVPVSQFVVSTVPITPATADVATDIAPPKDKDHVYTLLSVTLTTTRVITVQVIPVNTNTGPYVFTALTNTIHVLNKTQLPLVVPASHFLRVTVLAMNVGDGAATIGFQRIEKTRSLGFLFL